LHNAKRLFLAFEDLFRQSQGKPAVEDLAPIHYVIYSANESSIGSGAGYWSNQDGWVDELGDVSFFSQVEKDVFADRLPHATGFDAQFIPVELEAAGVQLLNLHEQGKTEPRLVSFYAENNPLVEDDAVCFYTTYIDLVCALTQQKPLFDDVLVAKIDRVYFRHIEQDKPNLQKRLVNYLPIFTGHYQNLAS